MSTAITFGENLFKNKSFIITPDLCIDPYTPTTSSHRIFNKYCILFLKNETKKKKQPNFTSCFSMNAVVYVRVCISREQFIIFVSIYKNE